MSLRASRTAYELLAPEVKAIVDGRAAELVEREGGRIEAVREALARRVTTTTPSTKHGTGH